MAECIIIYITIFTEEEIKQFLTNNNNSYSDDWWNRSYQYMFCYSSTKFENIKVFFIYNTKEYQWHAQYHCFKQAYGTIYYISFFTRWWLINYYSLHLNDSLHIKGTYEWFIFSRIIVLITYFTIRIFNDNCVKWMNGFGVGGDKLFPP